MRAPHYAVLSSADTPDFPENQAERDSNTDDVTKPFTPGVPATKADAFRPGSSAPSILVVDDEESIRHLFEEILTPLGFRVRLAADGEQASALLDSEEADLAIVDLVMPKREGIETITAIRRGHANIKIIAMSGAFAGSFLATAKLFGADLTLVKPVSPDVLEQTVKKVLS